MARVTANSFIGGGLSDAVYSAVKGTTFPTTLVTPSAPFVEVGWLGEDGIEVNQNVDRKEFKGHQGGTILRRKVTGSGRTFTFTCLEHNLGVLNLVLPGTTWTKASSVVTGVVPEGIQTVELAWVVDSFDSTYSEQERWCFTGEATNTGSFKYGVEDMTAYTFELAVYGSPIFLTNKASVVAAVT
jgi:hypothetical protein